ncbi:hypothetical protein KVT40_006580 [Elsinoe batatas]|uniref:MYND-type zinc finger protein samB n=1 Tax=Elsinoe batatas TaxID=2601811 RepID=A0A8K0KY78_9PEZI|nr:hypothetical protein KVT40_006580 [Elsinoe batatas]
MIHERHARVGTSSLAGDGLFAIRDIEEGELIASLPRPLIAVLSLRFIPQTCGNCFRSTREPVGLEPVENVFFCTGCKRIKYCSKTCQAQSWKRSHKLECKIYQASNPPPLPSAVRLVLQLVLMRNNRTLTDEESKAVEKMAKNELVLDDLSDDILMGMDAVYDLLRFDPKSRNISRGEIESIFSLMLTNTLTLVQPMMEDIGLALDPYISKANHSCEPNAIVVFDGCVPSIRSVRPIAKDEEICQSYIDFTLDRATRQERLESLYGFKCICPKCAAEDPEAPSQIMVDLHKAYERVKTANNPTVAIPLLKAILVKAQEHKIPATRQPIPDTYQLLATCSNITGDYRTSFLILIKLFFTIDPKLYKKRFFVTRVVHTWTLALVLNEYSAKYRDLNQPEGFKNEWGIDDILIPMFNIAHILKKDILKSHGPGRFADAANQLASQFDEVLQSGPQFVGRYIRDDPGNVWMQFERLKHNKIDLSGAAPSIYEDQAGALGLIAEPVD